jgi:MerR family transcriptional regulator/heat shock protein HspR
MRYGVPQDENTPAYVISVAAEMAEMHPQTLRHYDQIGLVSPSRSGRQRLYSLRDIALNQEVGELKNQLAMVTERLNDFEHKDRNSKLAVYQPRR